MPDYLQKLKSNGKKIVFTNGCFDILHVGHIRYLKEARQLGDCLLVGLNADESVKKNKGPSRPINSLEDRREILMALNCVDYVYTFEEDTPINLIEMIKPDILVKGGDYKASEIVGYDYVQNYGGIVKTIEFHKGYSSTKVINILNNE